ncbi:heparinase II/III family protein [Glycocaulis sp.]|uniref:heparinase II/III family protein n=1 Tax=Glycocaulis sp. TaxID=1969725 RepID=UPI003F6FCF56
MASSSLHTLMRYFETLRHLKPQQIYHRIWFRLARPKPDLRAAPSRRPAAARWSAPARRHPSMTGATGFCFLSEPASLDEAGWDDPARDKLWRYNLHYFDDLNAADASARAHWHGALIRRWIAENPPGKGTGWEPYPVSLRIVNWIKWLLAGNTPPPGMVDSLAVQARWLMGRLEYHLLGNHLFANAKALVFAGSWFDGREADSWRQMGFSILAREFDEQILPDGGQFELSPMYHALAVEDVLDLVNITAVFADALEPGQAAQADHWRHCAPLMLRWLAVLSHPDGKISFFNDAAFGIAPDNRELAAYAGRLDLAPSPASPGPVFLEDSGYARLELDEAVLIADLAAIGPDYLPGHAHADTLSFELSLFGQRVIVNSGTSVYGTGAERQRQRGTPAHSTVNIAGENSSDVWSGFRVGRRAKISHRHVEFLPERQTATAGHDGYRHRPGRPAHTRTIALDGQRLTIEDTISAPAGNPAEAVFHLHPDVSVQQDSEAHGTLTLPGGKRVIWQAEGGRARIAPSSWHPEFGMSLPANRLTVPLHAGRAQLTVSWGE